MTREIFKKNVEGARNALIDSIDKDTERDLQTAERLQIRLSPENYKFLVAEAARTGNTMSGLASLAVADWLDERRMKVRPRGT